MLLGHQHRHRLHRPTLDAIFLFLFSVFLASGDLALRPAMNTGTRRQFTAAFKRKVVEFAEANGNMLAQRQFGVSEKSVRYWRNQKSKLSVCNARKTSFRGRRAVHPELEDKVADFVREYRARSLPVSAELIRTKAVELAREAGLSREEFKGSIYWVRRFMRRKGFALRRRTSICQKLPEEYEDKLIEFQLYVNSLRRQHGYVFGQIGNADETPVWFDMPSSTTVCERGAKEVKLLSTGSEHSRFTVMLSCTADGRKLPPFIIFKRKTLPKEAFPRDVVVRVNEKGYMDEALMREWIRTVWNRRPGALLQRRNMLVLDAFRGHLTTSVKEALRDGKTDLVVIPGGMTSTLQPLDVVLNKPFKDRVRAFYNDWMAGDNPRTPTGRLRRPPLATVCAWVSEAWRSLPEEMVVRAFKKCCISNALDGTEDDMLWEAASEKQSSSEESSDSSED